MSRQLSLFKYISNSSKSSNSANESSSNKRRRCESEADNTINEEGDQNG